MLHTCTTKISNLIFSFPMKLLSSVNHTLLIILFYCIPEYYINIIIKINVSNDDFVLPHYYYCVFMCNDSFVPSIIIILL